MKTLTTLVICLVAILGKLEAQDSDSTLVLYYPLNEIYDIYVPDESGNDHRGLAFNTWPAKDRFGQRDMALYFNGYSFINFEAEQFNFDTYSYCMWVKIEDQPYYDEAGFIFDIGSEYGVDQYVAYTNSYSLYNLYGFLGQGYNTDGSSSWISQGDLVFDEEWHFIVYSRSYQSIKLFFDGELIDELDINQTTPLYGNEIKGYVGCRNNLQQFFKGYIDDVQLYNYAISQDDIIQLLGHLPTNIGEKYSNEIKVYPNPVRQILNINLDQNIGAFTIDVYDIYGKKVLSMKNQTSLGVEFLTSGVYIIKLRDEDGQVVQTTKFIKQ